jgi:outer membrane biosynthesis protein TonB
VRTFLARAGGEPLRGVGVLGSALLHGTVILGVLLAARGPARAVLLPAYRVELVAAPLGGGAETPAPGPAAPAPAKRESAAPRPAPRPTRPRVASRPTPAPSRPAQSAGPPAASQARPGATAAPAPATNAPPGPGTPTGQPGGTGADVATIRTEGVEFPFPGYLRNLVAQVYRRWRPPSGNANLEAEVLFVVHRDGSISGLQFVRRSGSFGFDLEAQGAIEAAARSGGFGSLPAGYGPDVLPVSFFFSPRSLQ